MTVSYMLKTNCRDVGNHSSFLMKNPDLPGVSRRKITYLYDDALRCLYYAALSVLGSILINIRHEWSFKIKLLFYIKALRLKKIFSLHLLCWSKQWNSRNYLKASLIKVWFLQHIAFINGLGLHCLNGYIEKYGFFPGHLIPNNLNATNTSSIYSKLAVL